MRRWACFYASLFAHALVLGASAMAAPSLEELDDDDISINQLITDRFFPRDVENPLSRYECDDCPRQARLDFMLGGDVQADACRLPDEIARCYPEDAALGEISSGRRAGPPGPEEIGLAGIGDPTPPARPPGRPHVRVGPVRIIGQLEAPWRDSVNDVNEAVLQAAARVRRCYVRALRDTPELRGRVTVRVDEEANVGEEGGTVTHMVVRHATDITDPAFLCCVDEAQSMVFVPVARGTATAVYSFGLRPGAR